MRLQFHIHIGNYHLTLWRLKCEFLDGISTSKLLYWENMFNIFLEKMFSLGIKETLTMYF